MDQSPSIQITKMASLPPNGVFHLLLTLKISFRDKACLSAIRENRLKRKKYAKRKVLVLEDSVVVRCPKGALFVGIDTSLTAEGFVDCTQGEGLDLIIMK